MTRPCPPVCSVWRNPAFITALVAALALAQPVSAAERCISKRVVSQVGQCAAGAKRVKNVKKRPFRFGTAGERRRPASRDLSKPVNPKGITKAAERDERRRTHHARQIELLITEIQNVERLYKSTPRKSTDRPALLRRLAEGYVELEAAAFRDKVTAEIEVQRLKRRIPKKAKAQLRKAKKASKVLKLARKQAIKYYTRLARQYPKWCQFPKAKAGHQGCTDEVLYYLAYEYEQAGKLDKARDVYLKLIDGWKKSRFIPNAFLAFGELFFNEAQGDPSKWGLAEQAYNNVIKYPPPNNKLFGYARYKLGYVYWNQGEFDKAIDQFKKVIEFGNKHSRIPNAKGLAHSARKDIIPVYALKGNPATAYSFFRPLSGDKGSSNGKTFGMMEKLGLTLVDTGHYDHAIVLYQDLTKRNPGDHQCFYRSQITRSTMATRSGNKPAIVAALEKQLSAYRRFRTQTHPAKAKIECANDTAGLMTETAMAWHLEAVGSGGVRGTGDPKTMKSSQRLYELVVGNFDSGDFKKFEFPRIVKEDWPTMAKIRYAMADLLYFQKKWTQCGPAFDAVAAEEPKGKDAQQALIAAVNCYQNAFAARHKDGSHRQGLGEGRGGALARLPLAPEQQAMVATIQRYLCTIEPPRSDRDALELHVEVQYALGRTYFEQHHWEEAAAVFRNIAMSYPELDAGIFAAHLYLEAMNVLGSNVESPRVSCYDDMRRDLPKLLGRYCGDKADRADESQCSVLGRVQRDLDGRQAAALVRKADQLRARGKPSLALYEKAAGAYLRLWKAHGEQACRDQKPGCEGMEAILYNAARAFQAARLIASAIAMREILIDPDYHLHETEPARKAVYEIGGNYQAIAVYDQAAQWYERFARDSPRLRCQDPSTPCPDPAKALTDAVVLRLGLGQPERAITDGQVFSSRYGAQKPAEAARIAFAIGAHYAEREDWQSAERRLSRAMRQIEARATPDVRMQAWALLARAYARQDRGAQADRYYAKVRNGWSDPPARQRELDALGGSRERKLRRLAKVLTTVGEALYHFADKKRLAAERIAFPAYRGSGKRQDVQRHIATKVKRWIETKEPALVQAERAYREIVALEPAPPPRWVIRAGAAVGNLWGRYVAEFRSAPYPKKWDQPGYSPHGRPPLRWSEIRAEYWEALRKASERFLVRAKTAYVTCLDYSLRYQYFDEDSRSCEEWLSKTYANEFHLVDEFRAAPTRLNSGLDEWARPLSAAGIPLVADTRRPAPRDEVGAARQSR